MLFHAHFTRSVRQESTSMISTVIPDYSQMTVIMRVKVLGNGDNNINIRVIYVRNIVSRHLSSPASKPSLTAECMQETYDGGLSSNSLPIDRNYGFIQSSSTTRVCMEQQMLSIREHIRASRSSQAVIAGCEKWLRNSIIRTGGRAGSGVRDCIVASGVTARAEE